MSNAQGATWPRLCSFFNQTFLGQTYIAAAILNKKMTAIDQTTRERWRLKHRLGCIRSPTKGKFYYFYIFIILCN